MTWISASWNSAAVCTWLRNPAPLRRISTPCIPALTAGSRPATTLTQRASSPPICHAASSCAKKGIFMLNATGQAQHLLLLGGTSEIGLGIISEFLENGPAKVSLAARADSPRIPDAVESLKAQGAVVEVIDFDATDFESHPAVIDKAFERGDVDVAVVACCTLGDQEELWQDQAKAVESAQINFTAPVSVGVLLGKKFKAQGHGTIVAMSSVAGMRVRRSNFVYGASRSEEHTSELQSRGHLVC